MAGHIINDFKDLRSLIGEVTKTNPAKTTYQQNAEKMGYVHESKTAGADLIRKAYIKIGRAAQGPIKKQMKMVAKELEKIPRAYLSNCIYTLAGEPFKTWTD